MTVQNVRKKRDAARSRALLVLAGVVLFTGLFVQITMLARISSQSKRASNLEGEIEELAASAENLELNINRYHNLESIALRAKQLGMSQPEEGQIRVVSVAHTASEASVQAAANSEAEAARN